MEERSTVGMIGVDTAWCQVRLEIVCRIDLCRVRRAVWYLGGRKVNCRGDRGRFFLVSGLPRDCM